MDYNVDVYRLSSQKTLEYGDDDLLKGEERAKEIRGFKSVVYYSPLHHHTQNHIHIHGKTSGAGVSQHTYLCFCCSIDYVNWWMMRHMATKSKLWLCEKKCLIYMMHILIISKAISPHRLIYTSIMQDWVITSSPHSHGVVLAQYLFTQQSGIELLV